MASGLHQSEAHRRLERNKRASEWFAKLAVRLITFVTVCAAAVTIVKEIAGPVTSVQLFLIAGGAAALALLIVYMASKLFDAYQIRIPELQLRGAPERACPAISDVEVGTCPLGLVDVATEARESLMSIFETQDEFHFVGYGSENIFIEMEESARLRDFREHVESRNGTPVQFHFVVRDHEDPALMRDEDAWRFGREKPVRPVRSQIENAISHHNQYRSLGWALTTYRSNSMASFRVVLVDNKAYISFNERGKSSQTVPQLIVEDSASPYNLYRWFKQFARLSEKDVERANERRLTSPSVIRPSSSPPNQESSDCVFCNVINGKSRAAYDKILFQNEDFVVIPAKGHFWPGYLLAIPKEHVYSLAAIHDLGQLRRFRQLIDQVHHILADIFGPCIMFEHSSVFGGQFAGNTIDHAHLHLVPCNVDLCRAVLDDFHGVRRVNGLDSVRSLGWPYLFIENTDGKCYAAEVDEKLQSQYLRRHLYGLLYPNRDDDGWDWRHHVHESILSKTLHVLNT